MHVRQGLNCFGCGAKQSLKISGGGERGKSQTAATGRSNIDKRSGYKRLAGPSGGEAG